jgi:2-oxoglutarate ferredoxin oxidoreductase subunit alpha
VLLLSDGAIANGSEPWRLPEGGDLLETPVQFATEPNGPDGSFLPYARDAETLARPWAVPGTPGLEHRIGGLEKADLTGNISYDPANHEFMVRMRQAKIDGIEVPDLQVDDPVGPDGGTADVLVLGWGSTFGPIGAAVRRLRNAGHAVAQAHLRHLNPFPANTADVLRSYSKVVVPEMNLGQLAFLLQGRFCIPVESVTKVAGLPFGASELADLLAPHVTGLKEGVSA